MQEYDWNGWSDWTSLDGLAKSKFADVSQAAGAYAIATTKRPINRFSGIDKLGLIYVGESDWLPSRIKKFHKCITDGKTETHVGGWRYNLVKMKHRAPPETLIVRWFAVSSDEGKKGAKLAESKLLYRYVYNHCELPPLNYSLDRTLMEKWNWSLVEPKGA